MSTTLLSVAQLSACLEDRNLRVFDCRHDLRNPDYGTQAYARGHIPGAQFLHLDRDLSGTTNGSNGRHPLPERKVFAATLSRYGVCADTQVVAYDNEGGIFAARLWWMLRWMGHFRVAVLNGGLAAWKMAKLPLSQEAPVPAAADFQMRPGDRPLNAEDVLANLDSARMLLLDARDPDRFSGAKETLDPVGGHIPGAINRFFADNLDENGIYFKPAAELSTDYSAILNGRDPGSVVQTCGSGVTACHNLLAMETAGLQGSRLYPGSWSEWCADPTRPIAQGDS
ncbi:MAG: sulfurtransferase [Betaproteobacteria bacterium]|nr:sulfurtransferase [Betaproteobacteria bacterium]